MVSVYTPVIVRWLSLEYQDKHGMLIKLHIADLIESLEVFGHCGGNSNGPYNNGSNNNTAADGDGNMRHNRNKKRKIRHRR
jgi:CDGSH-type Zn-finger protein